MEILMVILCVLCMVICGIYGLKGMFKRVVDREEHREYNAYREELRKEYKEILSTLNTGVRNGERLALELRRIEIERIIGR